MGEGREGGGRREGGDMNSAPIAVEFQPAENGYVLQFWEPSAPGRYEAVTVSSQRIFVAPSMVAALRVVTKEVNSHFIKEPAGQ